MSSTSTYFPFSLAWLIDPLSVQDFFDNVFAVQPYHIMRNNAEYFAALPHGPAAVETLISAFQNDVSELFTVREEDHNPGTTYAHPDGSLNRDALDKDFQDGYTIVVNHLERFIPSLTSLSNALERELSYATQINAYITPPGCTGFLPHYDHHDVFAVQVYGEKLWHFYGDFFVPPHQMRRKQELSEIFPNGFPASRDLTTCAGDTLYLPRGRIHAAQTIDHPSVHLTVGIHVPTMFDLLNQALNTLSFTDDRIHRRLPAYHLTDPHVRQHVNQLVDEALELLGQDSSISGGLEAFEDLLVRRGQAPPVGSVTDALDVHEQMLVAKYQPLYSRVIHLDGRIGLQFAQLVISADPSYISALQYLSDSTQPFYVHQIPGLSCAQQIQLVRQLITNGFLHRVDTERALS